MFLYGARKHRRRTWKGSCMEEGLGGYRGVREPAEIGLRETGTLSTCRDRDGENRGRDESSGSLRK